MYHVSPKIIARTKLKPKTNQCFVVMPFAPTFDEVYAEIKSAMKQIGFSCVRADDIYAGQPIMTTVVCETIASHFVIADLTGKSANVFYEVGIAHSFRDMTSVVLLSQSLEFVPVDLQHLPVIIYDRDNLRGLTSKLIRRVLENKDFFAGQVRLRERYESQIGSVAVLDEVISFLEEQDRSYWKAVLHLLDLSDGALEDGEIVAGIFQLRAELAGISLSGRLPLFRGMFRIYKDLLARFLDRRVIEAYVIDVLREQRFSDFTVDDTEMASLTIDLALAVFSHPKFKRRAIEWIFEYLSRPKTAAIDINRSKIEHFIMYSGDPDIMEALVYALEDRNGTLREVAADFIGELRLRGAVRNLVFTLQRETGPYTTRSMFSALGKIGDPEGAPAIITWLRDHVVEVGQRRWDFIVRHAQTAVSKIDQKSGTNYMAELTPIVERVRYE